MPRITRVYTRTGDDGTTGLGDGSRVPKNSPRVTAYGAVDELNSHIGAAIAAGLSSHLVEPLRRIQNELFHLGADLCTPAAAQATRPVPHVSARHVEALERLMDELSESLSPLENFVLPGGSPPAAALHIARAVCRRAERDVLTLSESEPIRPESLIYLNRLSDALFVMARSQNAALGVADPLWDSRA
ncbi:MAG: cob(I)yrinic acid a,c-diamide adenosyltransferase [Planctomycetia bacterium]|nr:MAG: cob(I)yrinic acid a,c-diamide adenosyltransferase [Planctomycetia bacterium]